MRNHNQFLLSIVSYSFYLFGEFAEVLILTGKSDAYNKLICIVGRVHFHVRVGAGAIIRDGDRKSWDARGPMIWDNFSIFRTNCAILTSYTRADPRTCRGLSRGCCHVM